MVLDGRAQFRARQRASKVGPRFVLLPVGEMALPSGRYQRTTHRPRLRRHVPYDADFPLPGATAHASARRRRIRDSHRPRNRYEVAPRQ
jgi:hypothetical protein